MKRLAISCLLTILGALTISAQVAISPDNSAPDSSAMLDVISDSKGVLFPRLTQEEIENISGPANGLTLFCTSDNKLYSYIAFDKVWKEFAMGTETISPAVTRVIGSGTPLAVQTESLTKLETDFDKYGDLYILIVFMCIHL